MIRVDRWESDTVDFYHEGCYDGNRAFTEEDPKEYMDVYCAGCGREIVGDE